MLSAHTLLVAAIVVPYTAMMVTLGLYMRFQARRHVSEADEPPDTEEPGDVLLAA